MLNQLQVNQVAYGLYTELNNGEQWNPREKKQKLNFIEI